MQSISIQIQPEQLAAFDRSAFLAQVRAVGRSPEIDEFEEQGTQYLSYNFFTEQPKKLWQDLQTALYKHPAYAQVIAPVSIAVYEDESHPQGFVLLHHFDPAEATGSL